MSFFPGTGSNPRFGQDTGPAPTQGGPGMFSGFGFGFPQPQLQPPPPYYPFHYQQPTYTPPPASSYYGPYAGPLGAGGLLGAGAGAGPNTTQPTPALDPSVPASNLTNSTGGTGCEPGYNYFFPAEHTKMHVLKPGGSTPPWQLPPAAAVPFHAAHVPVNTTVAELLRGFGAAHPNPKRNRITEVVQGGAGRWYKGLSFGGDDRDAMARTCKELGWDASRNGLPGGKPVVYVYVTKD